MLFAPTLNGFLTKQFLGPLLGCLVAFVGIHVLANAIDRFDDVVVKGGSLGFQYLLMQIPIGISELLPPTCLVAVLLTFGLLNRSGEVLAFQGLGIGRAQVAMPLLAVAVLVTLFDFGFSETVVPYASQRARHLLSVEIRKEAPIGAFVNRGIWIRQRDGFISADLFDTKTNTLRGITLYHTGPNYAVNEIQYADRADWDGKQWRASKVQEFHILDRGNVKGNGKPSFKLTATPREFSIIVEDPDQFGLGELQSYISELRRKGLDPGAYLVERDLRFAQPVSCLIMIALGIALSLDPVPRRSHLGRTFAIGIVVGFLYWMVLGFTLSFGRSGLLPSLVAAWAPNILFVAIAMSVFLLGEER